MQMHNSIFEYDFEANIYQTEIKWKWAAQWNFCLENEAFVYNLTCWHGSTIPQNVRLAAYLASSLCIQGNVLFLFFYFSFRSGGIYLNGRDIGSNTKMNTLFIIALQIKI